MNTLLKRILFLGGLAAFLATAHAQFSGNYAITSVGQPAGYYFGGSLPAYTPVTLGNWTAFNDYLGSVDTTNAASGSITFDVVSLSVGNAHPYIYLTAVAATDIQVSFIYSASSVYSTGGVGDHTQFAYSAGGGFNTSDFAATAVPVTYLTTPVSNGTIGATPVSFNVASGQTFGFLIEGLNLTAAGSGMQVQISNFTVSAVPEPSAYAALLGFGALGFVFLRRRRLRA